MTEIRIAISPETLALLEMSMTEGDTYDAVIMRLMKTPWTKTKDGWECEQRWVQRTKGADFTLTLPEGLSIDPGATGIKVIDRVAEEGRIRLANLAKAALAVRDDIARTVGIKFLFYDDQKLVENAVSCVINAKNILELDQAVKAVFDE